MNDLLLLSTLLDGPKHGYALKKLAGLITGQSNLHNNLVYPLLKRFVEEGWVSKRTADGQRGQIREVYALTAKGKRQLIERLSQFTEKEARDTNQFHLRVGLFSVLGSAVQTNVLSERDRWLAGREEKLAHLIEAMDVGLWGAEVVRRRLDEARSERKWIGQLGRRVSEVSKAKKVS
jgi:DNA-binding PadR family transcriptional regulator